MANKYMCMICTKPLNSIEQAKEHNKKKPHQGKLKARGLPICHEVDTYLSDHGSSLCPSRITLPCRYLGLDYRPKMEILYVSPALDTIQGYRSKGIGIPWEVKCVVRVSKLFDLKSKKNLFDKYGLISCGLEITGSMVLVDGDVDEILGILCHNVIAKADADVFCEKGLSLSRAGGCVERSPNKEASAMQMFGYRFAGGDFDRYKHPWERRAKGEKEVPKEMMAKSTELELYASIFAQDLYRFLAPLFTSFLKQLEALYNEKEGLGRIGTTPFSTMGVSENYCSGAHVDNQDFGFCFISWFLTRTSFPGKDVKAGGEFLFPEYGIYFRPRHGSILAINSKKVYHATRTNIGYTQLGVVLLTKKKLADGGAKRKRTIELL